MPLDAYKNFAIGTLAAGINNSVTSLSVTGGHGARFPAVPFNAVIFNSTDYADPALAYHAGAAEIVRVTAIATDAFTITRAQESTSAVNLNTGGKAYSIIAGLTAKFRADLGLGSTIASFTPSDSFPPSSAFATLDTRNAIPVIDFDDSTEEHRRYRGVIPDGAVLTSGLIVRIQIAATTATSGNVRMGARFFKLSTDIDSDSFDSAAEAHIAVSATSGIFVWLSITCTALDGLVAGDPYLLDIYRDASDTTNDTVTGDAEIGDVEIRTAA